MEGMRPRGASRKQWLDNIREWSAAANLLGAGPGAGPPAVTGECPSLVSNEETKKGAERMEFNVLEAVFVAVSRQRIVP